MVLPQVEALELRVSLILVPVWTYSLLERLRFVLVLVVASLNL